MMGVVAPILALVTCCSASGDPAAEQSQSLQVLEATQPGTCGGAERGEPAERLRSCRTDYDCVAVPVVGCCHNGWMTSVNSEAEDEYEHSFRCPTERPICPMYLVRDTREPQCDPGTALCELVPASDHCVPASSP